MLFMNAYVIFFVCLFSAYLATLGFRVAVVVIALDLIYTAIGGFYDVMDLTGWTMLLLPAACALIAATLATWWRKTHPPEPDFVPPPPSADTQAAYRERRERRRQAGRRRLNP